MPGIEYSNLLKRRLKLIQARNKTFNKPFYIFRRKLKKEIEELDTQIQELDEKLQSLRRLVRGKKIVRSSNLSLRFYKRDGWLKDTLDLYMEDGKIIDSEIYFGDSPEESYFVFELGSIIDIKTLFHTEIGEVQRTFDDKPEESDLDFCKRMITLP